MNNCKCCDIGTHNHNILMKVPDSWSEHCSNNPFIPTQKMITCDMCMAPIIQLLIDNNIETIESCCGHGIQKGYILLNKKYKSQMLELGFVLDKNWSIYNTDDLCVFKYVIGR